MKRHSRMAVVMASLLVGVASGTLAGEAHAQAVDTSSGDIIVTAQKREQNVQDVPLSVQVLGKPSCKQTRCKISTT
ncbi:hypothetical protein ACFSUK_26865 [Sphingobium scionense]